MEIVVLLLEERHALSLPFELGLNCCLSSKEPFTSKPHLRTRFEGLLFVLPLCGVKQSVGLLPCLKALGKVSGHWGRKCQPSALMNSSGLCLVVKMKVSKEQDGLRGCHSFACFWSPVPGWTVKFVVAQSCDFALGCRPDRDDIRAQRTQWSLLWLCLSRSLLTTQLGLAHLCDPVK